MKARFIGGPLHLETREVSGSPMRVGEELTVKDETYRLVLFDDDLAVFELVS